MGSNGDVPAVPRTNGGFFRPSVNAATTAQTTSTLDSAIEHMRQLLNVDGQQETSNAERARRMFLDLVPAQNLMADERRKEYKYEYGPALFSNKEGCSCFCGRCSMSQDLCFMDMRTYLYTTPGTGESEVILTSNRLHFQALEENGAVLIRWTAFGSSHTQQHIAEKCPPLRTSADEDEDGSAPAHDTAKFYPFSSEALPSLKHVQEQGLPPVRLVKGSSSSWTVKTLNEFMETPFDLGGIRFPPATLWPLQGNIRKQLYARFMEKYPTRASSRSHQNDQHGDQVLKNAFKIYSILHLTPPPEITMSDDHILEEVTWTKKKLDNRPDILIPRGASEWACLAQDVARTRVHGFNASFYDYKT
jgi:hypothetical protein